MRSAIVLTSLLLIVAASFAVTGGDMKYIVSAPNNTPSTNVSVNSSESGHLLIATRNQTMNMNNTIINKTINATNQEAEKVMNLIKNKENKTYMFQLLHNSTNETITAMARENIMLMVQKSTELKNQLMNNKTLLGDLIPEYKDVIQKGTIQNLTVMEQNNQTVMQVKLVEQKKLFGFIPVNVNEEIITNGTNAKIEQPWWAIFAI